MIAICLVAGLIAYAVFIAFRRKNIDFTDKKILIIRGNSGLGLSLAKILVSLRAKVVVASRSQRNTVPGTEFISIDMRDSKTYESLGSVYDYIFCCAGSSMPGYFKDLEPNDYLDQMLLNYIGPISVLHHLCEYNKKPFSYVLVSSTAALFTFPGYSAYSPSKCALKSFYETANLELKKEGVDLYIYYPTSMNTAGFDQENTIKPDFTKSIEGMEGLSPDDAALILLAGMSHSHEIYSDLFTRLFAHDIHICKLSDIFYVSIAFFVCPIAKFYVKHKFKNS